MSLMETKDIKKLIPHRYPFLLVDRVLSLELNQSVVAIKNVTANEPFFMGHFPVRPVMPGVLIIEALAQAAGVLQVKSLGLPEGHNDIYFFAGVNNARFKRVVEPGDQLVMKVNVLKSGRIWKFSCKATVEDQVACVAEIMTIKGAAE